MDKTEAKHILAEQIARFQKTGYAQLVTLAESQRTENFAICGASGVRYAVELQFLWDDKDTRTIRILGSIDDGGIRAFLPLTDSALISQPQSQT